ncbi:hypothetical protein ACFOY2_22530 [Nonomuraea purpurea]|uniref:Uncharacterized protein n=1 Tax=Nonomuraea purpurea TaxID=1849276 RepID=A0ABV8G7P1_9ACTN
MNQINSMAGKTTRGMRKRLSGIGAAAPAAGMVLASPAIARADVDPTDPTTTHVGVVGDTLTVHGRYGDNYITIVPGDRGRVRVTDKNYPILPGGDCIDITDNEVECGLSGTPKGLHVDGHAGADTIINLLPTSSKTQARIYGGSGNDVI